MKNNNITLRKLIVNVNKELEEIYNKPVIEQGDHFNIYKHDEINGRKIIEMTDLEQIVNKYCDVWVYSVKFDLTFNRLPIILKTKRKKSNMSTHNSDNAMTITSIYIEDKYNNYLDKTIEEIIAEKENKELQLKNEKEQRKQAERDNFIQTLKDHNLSFEQFKDLFYTYKNMDYDTELEIKEVLK